MKRVYSWLLGAVFVTAVPRAALADDYVCGVLVFPGTSFGNYGMITFNSYSGPNCTGTFKGIVYLCSQGETLDGACASNGAYHFESAFQMASMAHSLEMAAMNETPVALISDVCQGGIGSCVAIVNFK